METEIRSYDLFTYNSWFLVLSMLGFGLLGVGILWIFQGILDIPTWIQYIFLTIWLAADFFFSGYAAAKPTRVMVNDRDLILETHLETTRIPWEDIRKSNVSDELLLISYKIKLLNTETISIIDFKWRERKEFYSFLQASYPHQKENSDEELPEADSKVKSFLKNNLKMILGIPFFMVYINISLNLDDQGAFYYWNPIAIYLYWVVPILTFFKLVFTQ